MMNKIQELLGVIHTAVNDLENEVKVYHLDTHVERIKEKALALLTMAVGNGENIFEEETAFFEKMNKGRRKPKRIFTLTRMFKEDGSVTLSIWNRRVGEFYIGVIKK